MCETSNLILICQKLGLFGPIKQKAKLPMMILHLHFKRYNEAFLKINLNLRLYANFTYFLIIISV